eukprot:CAMPEP_0176498000 /NCGR_PEP_ID=MMETSP0200_2-20121128/12054_1 /TAXON_ID=947934 /ORGANISM="Chaetoceros sp., Strain GSL56" /LENGTH=127 /DNA_ID=CAMNT_0017896111 /DNA_START=11 /DNA_END=391 /DNA_ORIENTATION=+
MNSSDNDLHYPNLVHCDIIPGAASTNKNAPPNVTISFECLEAMDAPLPELYDFHIEKEIEMKMKQNQDSSTALLTSIALNSKKDVTENFTLFQREAFKKMKSITDASDDVCVSLLSKTGFKLNDSIE